MHRHRFEEMFFREYHRWMISSPLRFGSDGIRVNLRASSVLSLSLFSSRLRLILSMNLSGCRWWAEIRELLKLNPCSSSCSPESRTTGETGGHTLRKTNSREDNALKHFARPMLLLSRRNLLPPNLPPPPVPPFNFNEYLYHSTPITPNV